MTPAEQKVEPYREIYKKRYKKTDKDFKRLVESFSSPDNARSYLKGFLGVK